MAVTDEMVTAGAIAGDVTDDKAREIITAALSNTGWQTIETAPTDGSWVFLYWPTMSIHMYPAVGFSHGDEYGWELVQDRDYGEVIPTHWMGMLPSPTKEPSFPKPDTPLAQLLARLGSIREAAQGVVDWADFALANPKEFDSHGVKNLDGPAFDKLRAALAATVNCRADYDHGFGEGYENGYKTALHETANSCAEAIRECMIAVKAQYMAGDTEDERTARKDCYNALRALLDKEGDK